MGIPSLFNSSTLLKIGDGMLRVQTVVNVEEAGAMKGRGTEEYNEWQCKEIVLACTVLRGIVDSSVVHDWERRNGRHRIARRDIVLCLLVKAYLNVSYRRLTGFLRVLRPYLLSHGTSTHLPCNRMPSMEGEIYPWVYGRECMEGAYHRD